MANTTFFMYRGVFKGCLKSHLIDGTKISRAAVDDRAKELK
jgi:hypothetical protein